MRVCHYVLLVYRSNNISQNSNVSKQTCINLFKMVRNILNTLLLFGRNAHNGPIHDMPCLYSRVGYKSRGWEQSSPKWAGKYWVSCTCQTGRHTYRQDVVTTQTRRRVGDVYCTASHRNTTTSPKLLTDKP